eukprot:Amastigsp_a340038_90.p3 type:complete len:162 gc:universal Amastigsp_a340038_90:1926-2411(+)
MQSAASNLIGVASQQQLFEPSPGLQQRLVRRRGGFVVASQKHSVERTLESQRLGVLAHNTDQPLLAMLVLGLVKNESEREPRPHRCVRAAREDFAKPLGLLHVRRHEIKPRQSRLERHLNPLHKRLLCVCIRHNSDATHFETLRRRSHEPRAAKSRQRRES